MKFLFVHQNFPGQFLHLVRHLARRRRHEVVFITEPNPNHIGGVRKVPYRKPQPAAEQTYVIARDLDAAGRRAAVVAHTAASLRTLGFTPDIVIGHHGWGELLNLPDIWPGVPLLGYMEFFYHTDRADVGFDEEFPSPVEDFPRIRAKNATNLLALGLGGHGQTPTEWQLSTYPEWAHPRIHLLREGVDLDLCKPASGRRGVTEVAGTRIGPREKLVTYLSRDLEPYRGFHVMMRTLPRLLAARADLRVVIVGGDGVSYGNPPPQDGKWQGKTWREAMLAELGGRIDLSRVHFSGRLDYQEYIRLLQRSDAHVYLTYPFVASWSLREALAMGCAVVGSDTEPVREFITHEQNGLLTPFFDQRQLSDSILRLIEDQPLAKRLRANARRYAEENLAMADYLDRYQALIGRLTGAPYEQGDLPAT
ncbi:MAG: glycosyltransferase [Rhodospirillales bacterium]|nr:glycosyltransferase [Rhodospirillales bacterium]